MAKQDEIISSLGLEVDGESYNGIREGKTTSVDIPIDDDSASSRVCCANFAAGNRLRATARTLLPDGNNGEHGKPVNGLPR